MQMKTNAWVKSFECAPGCVMKLEIQTPFGLAPKVAPKNLWCVHTYCKFVGHQCVCGNKTMGNEHSYALYQYNLFLSLKTQNRLNAFSRVEKFQLFYFWWRWIIYLNSLAGFDVLMPITFATHLESRAVMRLRLHGWMHVLGWKSIKMIKICALLMLKLCKEPKIMYS